MNATSASARGGVMGYVMRSLLRLPELVRELTHERRSFVIEAYLSLQAVMFGLWLLAPWDTFAALPVAYDALMLLPEWVWGMLFTIHGVLHLTALDRGDMRMRRRGTSVTILLWGTVLCGFVSAAALSTATPMYAMPVLAGIWAHNVHTNVLNGHGSGKGGKKS